jgi:hypothetical protein
LFLKVTAEDEDREDRFERDGLLVTVGESRLNLEKAKEGEGRAHGGSELAGLSTG